MDPRLQTYVVEDNLTIRENLIGTLEELACAAVVGFAETESGARDWLQAHTGDWDLAIVDLLDRKSTRLNSSH